MELSDTVCTYWVNFAKHGDPNGEDVPTWLAFSNDNPQVIVLKQMPHTGPVPSLGSFKVLDGYFAWRRTPQGEAWAK